MDIINNADMRLDAVLQAMNLESLTWADIPIAEDPSRALEQLKARGVRLDGAVLSEFVRQYHNSFPNEYPLSMEEIEEYLNLATEEKVGAVSRFLLRKHLAGEGAQSLSEAASRVYDKKKPSFDKNKSEFIKRNQDAMTFLGLWEVEVIVREKDSKIGGYNISPGEVLLTYHKHIFVPYFARAVADTNAILQTSILNLQAAE